MLQSSEMASTESAGEGSLAVRGFLDGTGQAVHRWATAGVYSRLIGRAARMSIPAPLRQFAYSTFARAVGADLSEPERELTSYGSLGEFFARRLRSGSRPIDASADSLVSPCDGTVSACGQADDGMLLQAKGRDYRIGDLVVDHERAEALIGGSYLTIYLAPRDYHRVHSPIAGNLVAYDYVPGTLWPVSPRFIADVPELYVRNERAIAWIDTPHGAAAVVLVGATGVGNLWLSHRDGSGGDSRDLRRANTNWHHAFSPGIAIDRGDELGAFQLGSTVVVLLPRGAGRFDAAIGSSVRCGQRIGTAAAHVSAGGAS